MNERLATALSDRYTIERELGAGGMATVYLAEDIKHHRKVAIKVLRPDLAAALGADRFMQEIEIAARLQHPHILGVHDSGQADGFLYYVMPYVEGESLREKLTRQGELPVHEAVRLLCEIADALGHAHHRGVVHRDIKPENVMLSGRHALVMDFGVAKAVNEASGKNRLTTLGVALGTPAYMAPEQASADPLIDHRADIYALGVVGYELLAGRPPFTGASPQQVLAAHVTQAPALVSSHRPALSPALSTIIMKALEKRPSDRWQTAEEMLAQLEPLATPSGGMTPTGTQPIEAVTGTRRRVAASAAVRWMAAIMVLFAAGYAAYRMIGKGSAAGDGAQSVAVLPFENVGGDSTDRAFADGVQSEILTDLTRLAAIQVTSRMSVQEYRNTKKPVKQIGTELGVRHLLQGQVQRAGNQVHVTVQLVDASSDRQIWAESYDRELTAQNIFAIQGNIASNVAQALRASFSTVETAGAAMPPTENLEALDWYHRGMDLFFDRGGSSNTALSAQAFEHAVALDSNFAGAWAGLASVRSWQVRMGTTTDTIPARAALDHAVKLAPSTPETGLATAYYHYYARADFEMALAQFRAVVAARPNDVAAIAGVGNIARRRGQWAEAMAAEQKVVLLDPRNLSEATNVGVSYMATRQYDRADSVFRRILIADPNSEGANIWLHSSLAMGRGDTTAARALINAFPVGLPARIGSAAVALQERFARHYELSSNALAQLPEEALFDHANSLIGRALNDLAAGTKDRARARADSVAQYVTPLLAKPSGGNVFGVRGDFNTALGIAEAIQGRATEAVRHGEEAVKLNPVSRDAVDGPRSSDGLLIIHLILGHHDEAIRLVLAQAHAPFQITSLMPTGRGTLLFDPLFDGIRSDPRIQVLLKDDAAWVLK